MFLNAMLLFHELCVKKTQENEYSTITTIDFLPQGIRKNSWSIYYKLFLNIHHKAFLFFLKMTFMLGFYQQHTFLKRHRIHSLCSLFRNYFSSGEMQGNLDTILGNQL